jgi:hypothetical protein
VWSTQPGDGRSHDGWSPSELPSEPSSASRRCSSPPSAAATIVARFAFGPAYFKEMKIKELKPSKEVKWTCITGADEWVGTTISFELQPGNKGTLLSSHPELADQIQQQKHDNGTLLILHHDDWKEYTPMLAECNYTWGQFLRSLKLLCETGKGRPWPHQHRTEP